MFTMYSSFLQACMEERSLREELSGVLQLLQVALRASHTTLPAARCYVQHVINAFARGLKYQVAYVIGNDQDYR